MTLFDILEHGMNGNAIQRHGNDLETRRIGFANHAYTPDTRLMKKSHGGEYWTTFHEMWSEDLERRAA